MRRIRLLSLLLTLCMVIVLLPVSVFAEETVITGTCGDDLTWSLDQTTGVLTISGTGNMQNVDSFIFAPWDAYRDLIRSVVIEEGVESIGKCMIGPLVNLESVSLPNSVRFIYEEAFYGCSKLASITLPENIESVFRGAFRNCTGLKEINIPKSTYFDGYIFEGCTSLESIVIPAGVVNPNTGATLQLGQMMFKDCTALKTVTIEQGVSELAQAMFSGCTALSEITIPGSVKDITPWLFVNCTALTNVQIEKGVETIGVEAFSGCTSLTSITLPSSIKRIGESVFLSCENLKKVVFRGNAPEISRVAFNLTELTAYYPENNTTWNSNTKLDYGSSQGTKWASYKHEHEYVFKEIAPTCTEQGSTFYECAECGYVDKKTNVDILGHAVDDWSVVVEPGCDTQGEKQGPCIRCGVTQSDVILPVGHLWDNANSPVRTCTVCGVKQEGYTIRLDAEVLGSATSVCVDGKEYPIAKDEAGAFVLLTETNATNLVAYTFNDPNATDIHTQYPTGMKVWMLTFADGAYKATYVKEFDNLLQYSGSSIRITGTKGIRMITSIDKTTKKSLTGKGLAGYTLEEYGTALAWASDLEGGNPLVLGQSYTKSNFAYKKGKADPVFKDTGKLVQYTNVLVGFNDDQCIPDIAMRPYIILKDANGKQITVYGGIVYRSIGYIAYQNRTAFKAGTSSYKYVWGIIHHVYGDKYDADYKG